MQPQNQQPPEVNPVAIPQPQGQEVQDPTKSANQAAGNLGFINTMQEHLLQHKASKNVPPQASQEPKTAPQQEQKPKQDNPVEEKKEPNMAEEFTNFKKEIEGLLDSKLGDLKREIESALTEEDSKESGIDSKETNATETKTTKTA